MIIAHDTTIMIMVILSFVHLYDAYLSLNARKKQLNTIFFNFIIPLVL